MVAETLKFIVDQFRAGRGLQTVIDKFADDMEAKAKQPPPPNPEVSRRSRRQGSRKGQAGTGRGQGAGGQRRHARHG
jgi:hypothetical protein